MENIQGNMFQWYLQMLITTGSCKTTKSHLLLVGRGVQVNF